MPSPLSGVGSFSVASSLSPESIIQYELGGAGGEEVAVVGGVHYLGVRAEGVLGTVEEDVAEVALRIVREAVDEVQREAVAHPDAGVVVPVVGPRLLGGTGPRHGEHAGYALDGTDDALAVAGLGGDKQFAELHLLGRLAKHRGGEALAGVVVAPDELVGSALRLAAAVAAPVEQHVVALALREDDGQARRGAAHEDVGDVAGGEVAAVVIDLGSG